MTKRMLFALAIGLVAPAISHAETAKATDQSFNAAQKLSKGKYMVVQRADSSGPSTPLVNRIGANVATKTKNSFTLQIMDERPDALGNYFGKGDAVYPSANRLFSKGAATKIAGMLGRDYMMVRASAVTNAAHSAKPTTNGQPE